MVSVPQQAKVLEPLLHSYRAFRLVPCNKIQCGRINTFSAKPFEPRAREWTFRWLLS